MSLMVDLECTPEDFKTCDQSSQLEPGFYRAIVNEVYEDHREPGCYVFKFKITRGHRINQIVTDWLRHPALAEDADKAKVMHKRFMGWMKRLGLAKEEHAAAGRVNCEIESVLGNEYVLKMVLKDQKEKVTDTNTGTEKWQKTGQRFTNLDFMGVFPLTHHEIPDDIRAELELPPAIIPPEEQAKRDRAAAKEAKKGGGGKAAAKNKSSPSGGGSATTAQPNNAPVGATAVASASRNYDDL